MQIPKGYELVEDSVIPSGYEAVEPEMGLGDIMSGVGNIAATAGVGLGRQIVEGLSETGGLLLGKGTDRSIQEAKAFSSKIPEVPLGENAQRIVQGLSEKYQAAPEMVKDIISEVINTGPKLGEATFQKTGSPLLSTGVRMLPESLESAIGMKSLRAVPKAAAVTGKVADEAVDIGKGIFKYQSPAKQKIAKLLREGSTDIETAKYKLDMPVGDVPLLKGPVQKRTKIQQYLNIGGDRIKKDRAAIESIKQGFDEGVIAAIKGASPTDKKIMLKMVGISEMGKKNARFGMTNRASDVAGDSLMKRIGIVSRVNRTAGKKLDGVAKSLRGKTVSPDRAVNDFIDDLSDMGISVSDDLRLNFVGSDIEGLDGPIRAITHVFNRMKNTKAPDAYDLHRMKKYIDENVTYGKTADGLGGKTEGILKNLRRNLDGILDDSFPEYNKVNSDYSETIGVLDSIQDVAGKKMDLSGANADKAIGTLMRRLMSNAQSRVNLLDSINGIEDIAVKHGGRFDDDLLTQVLFVDELDSVFGPAARTSFQGQIGQAVKGAAGAAARPADTAVNAVANAAEKARGINQGNAFKAIKDLLKGAE